MPRPRSVMRKVRDMLRLTLGEGMSKQMAARALGVPRTTVRDCLYRARAAGLSWPLPPGLDDGDLEDRLYSRAGGRAGARPQPEWPKVHQELKRKGVTLRLLWIEYKETHPDGWQYTQFIEHYRTWARHLNAVLRQVHHAGEKGFVDWAGLTIPITDLRTGAITAAQLFVAVLGASNYTYAEAFPSQELPYWIAGHVHAVEYWQGAPSLFVPDNTKTAVIKVHRYEPALHRTYEEFAAHYGSAVLPARPYKPRDKAKVEAAGLIVERWIVARLRKRTFFSINELNAAIAELLEELNTQLFKKLPGSRRSVFEEIEQPALRPLPEHRYEYATWTKWKLGFDYHVQVDYHYYSAPYQLVKQPVEARLTATTVEIFRRGRRVASHKRSFARYQYTTVPEHMPPSHREHLAWTPERIISWARKSGPNTAKFVHGVMGTRAHPEQGYKSCIGIIRLGKRYGDDRLDAACQRALAINSFSYKSVESILRNGLDRQPLPVAATAAPPRHHEFVRGAAYYSGVTDATDTSTEEYRC